MSLFELQNSSVQVSVSDGPTVEEEEIVLRRAKKDADPSMTTLEFSVPEDAPSGTIIGSVEHGDEMKIIGRPGL